MKYKICANPSKQGCIPVNRNETVPNRQVSRENPPLLQWTVGEMSDLEPRESIHVLVNAAQVEMDLRQQL